MGDQEIKKSVSNRYDRFAQSGVHKGPCWPSKEEPGSGVAVEQGLYSQDELCTLPGTTVDLSRGCGNPIAYADLNAGETVVDLGCGAGIDVILASRNVGPEGKVVGIDISPEMIEQAEQAVVEAGFDGTDIQLMVGPIEGTGLPEGFADAVISNCVINLCPDKAAVYREAFRILKPGGRIAVSDILLSEHLDQEVEKTLRENWSGCLGGAAVEDDYWGIIESAGFAELSIVSRHVLSPDELFVISCCPGEDFSNAPPPGILAAAQGKAESVKFHARKPS